MKKRRARGPKSERPPTRKSRKKRGARAEGRLRVPLDSTLDEYSVMETTEFVKPYTIHTPTVGHSMLVDAKSSVVESKDQVAVAPTGYVGVDALMTSMHHVDDLDDDERAARLERIDLLPPKDALAVLGAIVYFTKVLPDVARRVGLGWATFKARMKRSYATLLVRGARGSRRRTALVVMYRPFVDALAVRAKIALAR